ncbi:type II toxin-antitoxin system RelE/ParE family toxin [Proteus sp. G2672]|nr:type II toxin-antitoxin system RelE/ParE family toxin [Proteus sp. G2672]NBL89585.1 type II toxin-antitoxin system RelE/ParE family toxin [Proteus sp. G2673]NBM02400.1 type II toxin-antitoxin system RelE/ParE family toxin [Proteus sp. G2671]NBM57601.1 type II toxin-antitoxin system RelE/ParE family toxin [Proteus sp. G2667]NBM78523.1 type II toxin-antitoxin system RelE/ParE family toxin [Proteus sp. G2659]NBM89588.1 type II toxin-antitoxin system RelE/ParE family toxin [Proteus sp. G2658]
MKWLKNEPISFRCYKIKLRASGFRLVYQIIDSEVVILVIAIGKREESKANSLAEMRIQK